MKCPGCKADISENSHFCSACGMALPVRCPACGHAHPQRANFCDACGHKLDTKVSAATARPRADDIGAPHASAERRQLTVLFCDLVGSTALAARLDPEDLREIIGAYQRAVAATVTRYGGFLAKYMGDGVLAYFGYPQAHEDDTERAVRTGLALIDSVGRIPSPEKLRTRVGISTGLVVVGDLVGAGETQELGVVGETPNLAARLQAAAQPDTVVIGPMTRRLLADFFTCRDLGRVGLKGIPEPVQTYQVVCETGVDSRSEALYGAAPTPLVGRDEELDQLLRHWQRAKTGEGRVVLLSGEPGIGKSRLGATLQERLQGDPHACLRYFCSAHHAASALHPFIAQLEHAARFEHEDGAKTKLEKLGRLLAPSELSNEDFALLAELLSIQAGERFPMLNVTPHRKKEKTFEVLLGQIDALAQRTPVLMIFEDLHWLDPSARELLDLIIERAGTLPILLLLTFRPEFNPPWAGQAHVRAMVLSHLDKREGTALVHRVVGDKGLSSAVIEEIVKRTDGVPLFIEELTKAVLESGNEGAAKVALSKTLPSGHVVPSTLHALLMARLDRLGDSAKELAQVGAAIGREFPHELLSAVSERNTHELKTALDRLADAGLVFRRGVPPDATYSFKHALVQDASYGTLLRAPRQQLHARIATALEQRFPDMAQSQPEVLAHHLAEAGLLERAVAQWQKAGEKAARRAANKEAVEHFRRALSLNEMRPDTIDRRRSELAILSELGPALISIHGWAAAEAGAVFERACKVARQLDNPADLAPPLVGTWFYNTSSAQFARAEEISVELFSIARELNDPEILLQAHHAAWPTRFYRGLLTQACEHIDAGMALYDEKRHERHRYLYIGHDPGVCALGLGACAQWMLGYTGHAVRLERETGELARRLQHIPSLAHALWFIGECQVARGDAAAVLATATELLTLCDEHGLAQPRATALILLGWAMAYADRIQEGTERLTEGIALLNRLGGRTFLPRALCLLAETHGLAHRYAEGLEQIAQALAHTEETGERWYLSRLHQVRATLLRAKGKNADDAETSLREGLEVARAQGARGWELRAATALGRLWCEQGKRAQARELVTPIYGWFSEGFDTPDLREAKALLDDLE